MVQVGASHTRWHVEGKGVPLTEQGKELGVLNSACDDGLMGQSFKEVDEDFTSSILLLASFAVLA
eukprot:6658995-Ditylum_brightwellii.AAC.1